MSSQRTPRKQSNHDPFELERLADELAAREGGHGPSSSYSTSVTSRRDLPLTEPLSHENPHLIAPSFSAEKFLLSRSYTSLPELRSELRDYLRTLKEELVQLINDDYEAFISLSTDLRGEGERLVRLKWPLDGLKSEISESRGQLQIIQNSIEDQLKKRANLREEKALLHLLLKISDSVTRLESLLLISSPPQDLFVPPDMKRLSMPRSLTVAEIEPTDNRTGSGNRAKHLFRVATEYTQLLYHAEKASADRCAFVAEIQWRIDRIKSTLSSDLDHYFSLTLSILNRDKHGKEKLSDAERSKAMSDLTECLRTYDTLSLWRDAEGVLRREITREFLKKTIFVGALSVPHSPVIPSTPFPVGSRDGSTSGSRSQPPHTPYTPYTAFLPKHDSFFMERTSANDIHPNGYLLDDLENPLASLYNAILRFVQGGLKGIMEAAERVGVKRATPSVPMVVMASGASGKVTKNFGPSEESRNLHPKGADDGFDIMANVVWADIGQAIMDNLGSVVFAAGQPDEFRKNYETTQALLRSLEFLAPSLQAVQRMRAHPVYMAFERRWQLPVYFQLRWKEIVGRLEEVLEDTTLELATVTSKGDNLDMTVFATEQSACVLKAIASCWSANVYISALSHRFWRLTLQLLRRYQTWLESSLPPLGGSAKTAGTNGAEKVISSITRSSTPVSYQESQATERSITDDILLTKCSTAIQDVKQMQSRVLILWKEEISVLLLDVLENGESSEDTEDVLHQLLSSLTDSLPPLLSQVVTILSRRACEPLASVKSIPGQFRAMSNKHIPVGPSQFVPLILRPVKAYFGVGIGGGEGKQLKEEFSLEITTAVFQVVIERYTLHLTAMKKTEESLRRLKKGKKSGFSLFGGSSASQDDDSHDEERVRAQLVLDLEAFGRDAESLGVDVHGSAAYKALNYIVHADMSNNDI